MTPPTKFFRSATMTDYGYGSTHILAEFPFSLNNHLAANIFFSLIYLFFFDSSVPSLSRSKSKLSFPYGRPPESCLLNAPIGPSKQFQLGSKVIFHFQLFRGKMSDFLCLKSSNLSSSPSFWKFHKFPNGLSPSKSIFSPLFPNAK